MIHSFCNYLKLPAASPPAILIGGIFGGECARCFGSLQIAISAENCYDFRKIRKIRSAYMKDQANVPIVNIEDKNVQK